MVTQRKRLYRARERGAAVFIVVLVIAMLTAIGVFAASSASLSTTSAGHARVATQAHYLGEFAVQATLAYLEELGGMAPISGARRATAVGEEAKCSGIATLRQLYPGAEFQQLEKMCLWPFTRYDLEKRIGEPLLDAHAAPDPGSLGHADLDWNFRIEFTDAQVVPIAGGDASQAQTTNARYCRVAFNARTVLWPETPSNQDEVIAVAGSQAFLSGNVEMLCPAGN